METIGSMVSSYQSHRKSTHHSSSINSAQIITELPDAQAQMHSRLDEAIPKRYRSAGVEHPDIASWVDEYVQCPSEARSLMVMGPVGTGKTWAAFGALRQAAVRSLRPNRAGRYVLGTWAATTFPDFIAHMRPGYFSQRDDMTAEKYMAHLRSVPILLVDDLGVSKGSEWVEDVTHRLVSGRYDDELPTIYTTNLSPDELDVAIGARMRSRLAEQCMTVRLVGNDRRRSSPLRVVPSQVNRVEGVA